MPAPFDEVMTSLDAPMAVVTAAAGDDRSGCLIGFHAQASIHPPRYAVWLSKANHTFPVALAADHLGLHLLTVEDHDLAELFGTVSGDDVDKLARCTWTPGHDGVPLLERCPNRMVLRRTAVLDEGGDHVCFVTEPVSVESGGPFTPLRLRAVTDLEAGHDVDDRALDPGPARPEA